MKASTKKLWSAALALAAALCLLLGLVWGVLAAPVRANAEVTYSAKAYTPTTDDLYSYYGGVGSTQGEEEGVDIWAHATMDEVPLEGTNIQMTLRYRGQSKRSVEDGGDGVDNWLTLSFSKEPGTRVAGSGGDKTFPYSGGSQAEGVYLQITNMSASTAPNCSEVYFAQRQHNGTSYESTRINLTSTNFVDNALDVTIDFSLAKQENDTWTLRMVNADTSAVLEETTGITLNEDLFINDNGQTYFSTAVYESSACTASDHRPHRGVEIFSVQTYTPDVAASDVTLAQDFYIENGTACEPAVTVAPGGVTLEKDTDYTVTYADNTAAGTGKATVSFIGDYKGNADIEKTFTIAAVSLSPTQYVYMGNPCKPEVTVAGGGVTLTEDTDFTVAYADNDAVGTGKVTVTFIGDYAGIPAVEKTFTISAQASGGEEDAANGLSVKTYVPEAVDFIDYWKGVGDIDPASGDGITTFAHSSFLVPLQGNNIQMTTQYTLLSAVDEDAGGDGVDGWVTYSFSSQPGDIAADNTFPYGSGQAEGIYLQIKNMSGTSAPNCSDIYFAERSYNEDTGEYTNRQIQLTGSNFVDNALDTRIVLSLSQQEGGTWTLRFVNAETGVVLEETAGIDLNEDLFINEYGQTYFSTAIYDAYNVRPYEYRGVAVFSVEAYTFDTDGAVVTLSLDSYEYEEGVSCRPTVRVQLNGVNLTQEEDFYIEYVDNDEVGTASVYVYFINDYAGNNRAEKTFTITAAEDPGTDDPGTEDPGTEDPGTETPGTEDPDGSDGCSGGCGSSVVAGSLALGALALGAGTLLLRKKK